MIDKERIEAEAEAFFEWETDDRTYVTTTSMLIFANVIAQMVRDEERMILRLTTRRDDQGAD